MPDTITPESRTPDSRTPDTITPDARNMDTDLYRVIHKGLRHALFEATFAAGRVDPTDDESVLDVVNRVHEVAAMLAAHHEHEDAPVLDDLIAAHAPELHARIAADHAELAAVIDGLPGVADQLAAAPIDARRPHAHRLYLELAAFTGAYLAHLDVEERGVMPVLDERCAPEQLIATNVAIVSSIPIDQRLRATKYMLPALDADERAGLLGPVKAMAPPAVFELLRAVAERALSPLEYEQLAERMGI